MKKLILYSTSLAMMLFAVISCNTQTPQQISNRFIKAILKKDTKTLVELGANKKEVVNYFQNSNNPYLNADSLSYKFLNEEQHGKTYLEHYKMWRKTNSNKSWLMVIPITKKDGKWVVILEEISNGNK